MILDHPMHETEILGGMWGFKNSMDRNLAYHLFKFVLSKKISKNYNFHTQNEKGKDQEFLSKYFYPLIKSKSIIHDSFLCKIFDNSLPWPMKRLSDCFVGSPSYCNESLANKFYEECPFDCRPKNHKDWLYC